MDEEWKPVVGYEGWYSVSNLGRVRRDRGGSNNARPGRILKAIASSPYHFVSLHNGRHNIARIHSLVAAAFIGPRPPHLVINHKNGIKADNRLENLEYVTPSENIAHAVRTGLRHVAFGEAHGNAKLRESDVRLILTELAAGVRQADLVRRLGVSRDAISRIALGKKWRHISRRQ